MVAMMDADIQGSMKSFVDRYQNMVETHIRQTPVLISPSPNEAKKTLKELRALNQETYRLVKAEEELQKILFELASAEKLAVSSVESAEVFLDLKFCARQQHLLAEKVRKNLLSKARTASWLGEYQAPLIDAYAKYALAFDKHAYRTADVADMYRQASDLSIGDAESISPITPEMMDGFVAASERLLEKAAKGENIEFV